MATVLVVDDAAIQRDLLSRWLTHCGYKAVCAASCKQAWALLKSEPVDLILLDIGMPEMDGVTFLRILRRYPQHAQTPVIMLTEMEDKQTIVQAVQLGVKDYLLKSQCTVDSMLARIKKHLGPAAAAAAASA